MPVRSSDELADDEGTVFVTDVPDAPFQILGRRGPTRELFVGSLVHGPDGSGRLKRTAYEDRLAGVEIVTGREAEELISEVLRSKGIDNITRAFCKARDAGPPDLPPAA